MNDVSLGKVIARAAVFAVEVKLFKEEVDPASDGEAQPKSAGSKPYTVLVGETLRYGVHCSRMPYMNGSKPVAQFRIARRSLQNVDGEILLVESPDGENDRFFIVSRERLCEAYEDGKSGCISIGICLEKKERAIPRGAPPKIDWEKLEDDWP